MKYLEKFQQTQVIRIPHHTQVKDPLIFTSNDPAPLTIEVEPYASVSVIDEVSDLASSKRFIHVAQGAKLYYTHIQRCANDVVFLEEQVTTVDEDAVFQSVNVGLGARHATSHLNTKLTQPGAQVKLLGVFFGHEKQTFEAYTIQDHQAPDTQSDLLFKTALKDEAKSNYEGVIRIPKQSQRSNAFQTNRNLLLSKHAKARSIPKLEIIADDVRCKHAATMGTLNLEELFYLQSRGLNQTQAQNMVVEGFFEEVFSQIPSLEVKGRLVEIIQKRLQGG